MEKWFNFWKVYINLIALLSYINLIIIKIYVADRVKYIEIAKLIFVNICSYFYFCLIVDTSSLVWFYLVLY